MPFWERRKTTTASIRRWAGISESVADEAVPDVLLIRGALLDVVSYVPPDNISGRGSVFLSSVGEATLVIELRDSITNAILARAIDRGITLGN